MESRTISSTFSLHYIIRILSNKRIELSDAIYVVNIDGYIGDSTNLEIEYVNKLGKKIIYHEFDFVQEFEKYQSLDKREKENVKKY